MNESERTKLSKMLALLLRHKGPEHGLILDPEGFVPIDDLLAALHRVKGWEWVGVEHLDEIIATQQKRRYERVEDDIRAVYGHSVEAAVTYPAVAPLDMLFHGTARRFVDTILREGLRPMSRQYVHLTDDPALAHLTGRRRDSQPTILSIDAVRAHADGVVFFQADNGVLLAHEIPAQYLALRND